MSCAGLNEDDLKRISRNKARSLKIFCKQCNSVDLRSLLLKLVSRVESIETKLDHHQEKNYDEMIEDASIEAVERMKRAKNVIIYGIPETTGSIANRKEHDLQEASNILAKLSTGMEDFRITCFRLGKASPEKKRPLRVIFPNEETALLVLKHKKNLDSINFKDIKISDDKTPRQLKYLHSLRATLQNRLENGEVGLTIKFIKKKPTIVNITKN